MLIDVGSSPSRYLLELLPVRWVTILLILQQFRLVGYPLSILSYHVSGRLGLLHLICFPLLDLLLLQLLLPLFLLERTMLLLLVSQLLLLPVVL